MPQNPHVQGGPIPPEIYERVRFPWTFVVCPNASAPPHVGHIWSAAHSRYLFTSAQGGARPMPRSRLTRLAWHVLFDWQSKSEHEAEWLRMLDWLGWPPDRVDHARDWLYATESLGFKQNVLQAVSGLREMPREPHGEPILCKLLYYNAHHVYWHLRGHDLRPSPMNIAEYAVEPYIMPLRLPLIIYHSLLCDEEGRKLDSSRGVAETPEYAVNDDLMRHSPAEVLVGLRESLPVWPRPDWSVPADRAAVDIAPETCMGNLFCCGAPPVNSPYAGARFNLPHDWRKNIP